MKKFCLVTLLAVCMSFGLSAQDQAVYLNHIALLVKDLKTSTTFYENILQLKQMPEPFKDGLHTWFALGQAGQMHLIQSTDQVAGRNKHDHLCFSVKSIDDFVKRLNDNHVPYMNWTGSPQTITTRVDGIHQVFFQDPDGHFIEVNDDFPSK